MSRGRKGISILISLCLCFALLCMAPVHASAAGVIDRVLCSLNYEPVVMMELQYVNVSTSSANATITSAYWTDSAGNTVSGQFPKGTFTLNVNYAANPGFTFAQGIPGYINNKSDGVSVTVSGDGSTALLQKTFTAGIWTPTSLKDPVSARVECGGWTSFAVSSMYAESHEWFLMFPEGKDGFQVEQSGSTFPTLTWSGEDTERLVLHHIPAEMDGWRVFCRHWSVDHLTYSDSKMATITVTNIPTPEPTPEFTPVPLEVPTPEPEVTPEPAPAEAPETESPAEPAPVETPAPVEETFRIEQDGSAHWRVYEPSGDTGAKEEHLHVWHETRAATAEQDGEETGVCSVCGHSVTRALAYEGTGVRSLGIGEALGIEGFSDIQLLLVGGAAVCLLLLILSAALSPKKSRRRRR